MAARRRILLAGDDAPHNWPRWGKRFDELDLPFVYRPLAGMSESEIRDAKNEAYGKHLQKMNGLLFERAGLSGQPRSVWEWERLLAKVVAHYIPAFGPARPGPTRHRPGRPATGLTARQKAAIDKAVKAKVSVRKVCLRLAEDDEKKANAMAAAYRRATKPGMRRK